MMSGKEFGIALVHQPPEPTQGTYVKLAEDRGFESAWAVETRLMRDGVVPLSSWAARTKSIRLGTAMINPFTRTPTLMAQTFATLDELWGNRSVLGIGAANSLLIEDFHGREFSKPLTRTAETIEVVRKLMTGERVHYEGETIAIDGAKLDFQPPRSEIPIYMGVTGPKMLTLAGKIADGVILNVFVSDGYVEKALELIRQGADEADRDPPKVGVVPAFCIDTDGTRAKSTVKPMLAEYVCNLPGLERARRAVGDPFFERDDVQEEIMKPVHSVIDDDGVDAAADHVPDWAVSELAPVGTEEECIEHLDHYFDLGLDFVVPSFMGDNIGWDIDAIADHLIQPE